MEVNKYMVERLANLAKLEFNEEEKAILIKNLNKIIYYFDKLNELDTSDIPPLIHFDDKVVKGREDIEKEALSVSEVFKNTPLLGEYFFKVPKVLDK